MIKVLIIEDEELAAKRLKRLLLGLNLEVDILATLPSVAQSVGWLMSNVAPDLIFMDIQLEDGLSFEIFELCDVRVPIVFTTAYDEYTLKAFKVNSLDYILKPIKQEDLRFAIDKYRNFSDYLPNKALKNVVGWSDRKFKERFLVKVGQHYKSIETETISCFLIREGATFLRTTGGREYTLDYSLERLKEMLNPAEFYRINRNCLINLRKVTDMVAYSSSRMKITLLGCEKEPMLVSRDRVGMFKLKMDQ